MFHEPPKASSANRLIHETSPYLRHHAHDLVDWYPWCDEAFEKARTERKPVILSIGYSACHWCHVQQRESFLDPFVTSLMNESYVSIKVDREERPDLDQIYQSALSLLVRRGGGWPLTLFLTPDRVPFYGGTYFPSEDRYGLPGFPKILEEVASVYQKQQDDISQTTAEVQRVLQQMEIESAAASTLPTDILSRAAHGLSLLFDSTSGGFGSAPKFPSTPSLALLLRHGQQTGDSLPVKRVTYTLGKMAWGGIYDQLGGGFHRYATDARWRVPHFEKMLYDNTQLARLYFSTFQATGQSFYAEIGEAILAYVLREMTDDAGGFYSTQDADSEGKEGQFFIWTCDEIQSLLKDETRDLLCRYYDVTPAGNFEGGNILWVPRPLSSVAQEMKLSLEEAQRLLQEGRILLFEAREKRIRPFRDEKIITSLNGLMISGFVEGYQVTRNKTYLAAAIKAADFILDTLYKDGHLRRVYKDNIAKLNGSLDDYTYFMDALLDLYEATAEKRYLAITQVLAERLIRQFADDRAGGFFFTAQDYEPLITRFKPYMDQSVPSGNAVAVSVFLRLFYLTHDQTYFDWAEKTLQLFSKAMEDNAFATSNLIAAADFYLNGATEITVYGDREQRETVLADIYKLYLPYKIVRLVEDSIPMTLHGEGPGKPTVTICRNKTCSAPLTEWNAIYALLLGK